MSVTPSSTVVGIFTDRSAARQALNALNNAGFSKDQVHSAVPGGFIDDLKNLFTGSDTDASSLAYDLANLGLSDEEVRYYTEAYHNGNAVVAVQAPGREQEVAGILEQYGAYGTKTEPRAFDVTANAAPEGYTQSAAASESYAQSDVYAATSEPTGEAQAATEAVATEAQPQDVADVTTPDAVETVPGEEARPQDVTDVTTPDTTESAPLEEQPQEITNSDAAATGVVQEQPAPEAAAEDLSGSEAEQIVPPLAYEGDSPVAESLTETADQTNQPVDQVDTSEATTEYQVAQDRADDTQDVAADEVAQPVEQVDLTEATAEYQAVQDRADDTQDVATDEVAQPADTTAEEAQPQASEDITVYEVAETPIATSDVAASEEETAGENGSTPAQTESAPTAQAAPVTSNRLQALRQQLEATRQELLEVKARLQAAREHEAELQATRQELKELQAELDAANAELQETQNRLEQY